MEDTSQEQPKLIPPETIKIPKKMRAIPLDKDGKLLVKIVLTPYPIKDDEILIKVNCFGINFADILARKGQYPDAPPYPFIPGYEVSGTVVAIGANVNTFKVGSRVAALTPFGAYAEYAVAPAMGAFEIPDNMSFSDAASIPVAYVTAYYSLHMTGAVRAGDKILIHAAAGGVGLAAVQLAKLAGLVVYGTASSHKLTALKEEWGVDHCIDYRNNDFVEEIRKIDGTNKGSIDIIIDSLGGSQFKMDMSLLRPGGRVVGIGATSLQDRSVSKTFGLIGSVISMLTLNAIDILLNCISFCGVNLKKLGDERPDLLAICLDRIHQFFVEGKLRTKVYKVYDWKDTTQAHKDIESRITTGKLVIQIPPGEDIVD